MWSFLARLRERKLAHWAIAYLAGAWLLLQVLDLLAHPFAWPDLVLKTATVLLGIGFLAMLVLAWYHGERGTQRVSGVELLMLAGILVIAGAAVAFVGGTGRDEVAVPTSSDSTAPSHARTAIAVLPFENLGANGPYAYFAAGLHDELLTQLSKVAALSVRGRTSVMGYADTRKQITTIADELSVGTIVEGSVQVVGERLRVNVQLIDAATDEHLWAERYDRKLDDAFAVQSDIAQQIVAAVGAALRAGERAAIETAPTVNPEAYRLYLQGREYHRRPGYLENNFRIAQDFYERAVQLDSTFALAYAALSHVHGEISWFRYDRSLERLVSQRQAAETALRLAPDRAEGHVAVGHMHYLGERDWQAAAREYQVALEGLPNDAELWKAVGFVQRRLGNWDEALRALYRTEALDPRNANTLSDLGGATFVAMRRYPEALEWQERALALAPDVYAFELERAFVWLRWQGRLDSLRAVLERIPPDAALGYLGRASYWKVLLLEWQKKPDSALAVLSNAGWDVFDSQERYEPAALWAAWAHRMRKDGAAARAAFQLARIHLDSVMRSDPGDWRVHAARGFALAGLDRQREAALEARWLQESKIYREDRYLGQVLAVNRAAILAQIGATGAAVAELDRVLSSPADLSVHILRLDPSWDPIRNDPPFQGLLVKYARPQPH